MASALASLVFLAGLTSLVLGAALIWLPAGLLVGGASLMAGSWLFVRGGLWASSSA